MAGQGATSRASTARANSGREYPTPTLTPDAFPPEWCDILDEILRMYANSIQALGSEAVRADLKTEMQIGEKPIANPAAWLNTKLLRVSGRMRLQLRRHRGDRTLCS